MKKIILISTLSILMLSILIFSSIILTPYLINLLEEKKEIQITQNKIITEEEKILKEFEDEIHKTLENSWTTQSWNIKEETKKVDTSSWNTYQNNKYNYQIKFPEEYSTLEWGNAEKNEIIPVNENSDKIYISNKPWMFLCCEPIYLSIETLDEYKKDLEAWIQQYITKEDKIINKLYFTFAWEKAYKVEIKPIIGWINKTIILVNHDDITYHITYDNEWMYDEISKTFNFTNLQPEELKEIETNTWKIEE